LKKMPFSQYKSAYFKTFFRIKYTLIFKCHIEKTQDILIHQTKLVWKFKFLFLTLAKVCSKDDLTSKLILMQIKIIAWNF